MRRFEATPATEELASFLEGLPSGSHVAVDLGGLSMDQAVDISRQIARKRGERFIVVAHRGSEDAELVADSLGEALPLELYASTRSKAWVVVDAEASMAARSPQAHLDAETKLGVEVAARLTVVCFYTDTAMAKVKPHDVHRLHSVVATPSLA